MIDATKKGLPAPPLRPFLTPFLIVFRWLAASTLALVAGSIAITLAATALGEVLLLIGALLALCATVHGWLAMFVVAASFSLSARADSH